MTHLLVTALFFAVAISSTVCARLTRPDRNYYPMQRILWTILGGVYGGAALASLFGSGSLPLLRVVFAVAVLAGTLYSIHFMRRRNRVPRYLPVTASGHEGFVDEERLRLESERVTSVIGHGAAPESWVVGMEEACAKWRRLQRWQGAELPAQLAARRGKDRGQG